MDYNLAGIRQRVLVDKLDDDEFDPNIVDNFINDAQRDIFNQFELPFMEKIFSGTITAGSVMFKFPDDVAMIQSQVITGPDGTQRNIAPGYMGFRDFNTKFPTPLNNNPGPIYNWTLYGGNMLTSVPTDQEYTMTLFYIRKPKTLTEDTDVPEIPEEFSELLVLGAFRRVQERNEDYDLAASTEAEYQKVLVQMVDRYGMRQQGPIIMGNRQIAGFNKTRNGLVLKSY